MPDKRALVVGATGLVGKELIKHLILKDSYKQITVLSRRPLEIQNEKLNTVIVEDFEKLEEHSENLDVEDIYCVLGTTRKKAGSKENFIKVDHDFPLNLARLTKDQPSFKQFLVVTSMGANSSSPLFYNEVKGKLEEALEELNMRSLKIFQPSLLIGKREEFRFLESLAIFFSRLLSFFVVGSKKRLWSIYASEVAEAMYLMSKSDTKGVERYKPNDMLKMLYAW